MIIESGKRLAVDEQLWLVLFLVLTFAGTQLTVHFHHPIKSEAYHHQVYERVHWASHLAAWLRLVAALMLVPSFHIRNTAALQCSSFILECPPGSFWISAALVVARSSLQLLNIRRQFLWYFALFLLNVSSIPSLSVNLDGSNLIGNRLIARKCGMFWTVME